MSASMRPGGDVTIRRAVFPQDLPLVQQCFVTSHKTLYWRTVGVALTHLRSKWQFYAVFVALDALLCVLLSRFGVISNLFVWAVVLLAVLLSVFVGVLYRMSSSGWHKIVQKVVTEGDMSASQAAEVYNDPRNVCMVAVQKLFHPDMSPREVVVGSANVLTGAAAEKYRTQRAGGTDHVTVGRVTRVGVVPAAHGKGVGRKLVTALIAWARDERQLSGLRLITSTAQGPAIALYTAMGFRTIDTAPVNATFGIHELLMETTFKAA